MSVDLPDPDGPMTAAYSPGSMARETPRRASTDDALELVGAGDLVGLQRGRSGHGRRLSGPHLVGSADDDGLPLGEPRGDLDRVGALGAEGDGAAFDDAGLDGPDRVALLVAEHGRRGYGDDVDGLAHLQPRDRGHPGPRGRRR